MCSVLKVALSYILRYKVCADFVCIVFPSNRLMDLMNRPFKAQWLLHNTCLEDFMVIIWTCQLCQAVQIYHDGEPPVSSSSGF